MKIFGKIFREKINALINLHINALKGYVDAEIDTIKAYYDAHGTSGVASDDIIARNAYVSKATSSGTITVSNSVTADKVTTDTLSTNTFTGTTGTFTGTVVASSFSANGTTNINTGYKFSDGVDVGLVMKGLAQNYCGTHCTYCSYCTYCNYCTRCNCNVYCG